MITPGVILITGEKGSGKTSSLMEVLRWAGESSVKTSGIITPRCFDGDTLLGYDALDCATGRIFQFARKPEYAGGRGWLEFRGLGYLFSREGLLRANTILREAAVRDNEAKIRLVDEIGKLELTGEGLAPGFDAVLSSAKANRKFTLVSCRMQALDMVRRKTVETGAGYRIWTSGDDPSLSRVLESLIWPAR